MDNDLVKHTMTTLSIKSDPTSRDAYNIIERLSAENAALKQERAVRGTNCVLGSAQCKQLKDAQEALTNAVERIAELESGQPVEHRGEMWQLVPAKLPPEIVNAIHKRPSWPSTVHSFWRITIDALTASAQEAAK